MGIYLCALAEAELRSGTPAHVTVANCGVATPFVTVEKTLSEHWPVPSLPRKMCQSRYVSHPSARLFSSLSKGAHSFSIVSKSPADGLVCARRGSMRDHVPRRLRTEGILQREPSSLWRAQLEEFGTSPACVWCPAGRGSHPFPMLPLLSAGVWPSAASG